MDHVTLGTSKESWLTLLGFTNLNGDTVLCTLLFASKTITAEEKLGVDIFAETNGPVRNLHKTNGPRKTYPVAPKCKLNEKEIPAFISCTAKGCITSKLLCSILECIDLYNIFECHAGGLTPFLLLDGHGSQLELSFLQYVNIDKNKWYVCLGLPNGKSLWQVGDSSQ